MAFSEPLAQRIREVLGKRKGIEERKMFGGLATGKPMKSMVYVEPAGIASEEPE